MPAGIQVQDLPDFRKEAVLVESPKFLNNSFLTAINCKHQF